MTYVYALHAHDDLLELLIEGGVAAGALLLCLGALLVAGGARLRRHADAGRGAPSDILPVAATIACFVPLLHSLVDYPLRTYAVAVPFGLALATVLSSARAQPVRAGR
jgi:O-antigen ligase